MNRKDHQAISDASPCDTSSLFFFYQTELLDDQFDGKSWRKKEAVFKARGGGRVIDCGAWHPVVWEVT